MHRNRFSLGRHPVRNAVLLIGCGITACTLRVYWLIYEDEHFGEGIAIPSGMKAEEPLECFKSAWTRQSDKEFQLMVDPTKSMAKEANVVNNVKLPAFSGARRALLQRHLATSCKWRVSEEQGKVFAVRREVDENGNWISGLNGYISSRNFEPTDQFFSVRTVIGLDGPIYKDLFHAEEHASTEELVRVAPRKSSTGRLQTYFCDSFQPQVLEIFEKSPSINLNFTNNQLRAIREELDSLCASKIAMEKGFDPDLIPDFSIKKGPSELKVIISNYGAGVYYVDAFVNPGEPGKTHLKVFEATKNTPLSEGRVAHDSLEYGGWSANQNETFFYGSLICIYEGNWHTIYPARFELWFEPADQSKPERKLLERTYKIRGWER